MHPPSSPPSTTSSAIGLILARDKSVICSRFFRGGSCDVDNCPYAHFNATTELPMPESICYFHGKAGTTCKRDGCRFFHGSREAFESLKAAGATTYRPAWFLPTKDPVTGGLEADFEQQTENWARILERAPKPDTPPARLVADNPSQPPLIPSAICAPSTMAVSPVPPYTQQPAPAAACVFVPPLGVGFSVAPEQPSYSTALEPQRTSLFYPLPTYVVSPLPSPGPPVRVVYLEPIMPNNSSHQANFMGPSRPAIG